MDERTFNSLEHIHSLRIATREQIGGGRADDLLRAGLIRLVWINGYALTKKGETARREYQRPVR